MGQSNQANTFTVAQIGLLSTAKTQNALGVANLAQRAFHFEMHSADFPLDRQRYKFPNRGFDLDSAVKDVIHKHHLPKPLLFVTSEPYGERESQTLKGAFIFGNHHPRFDPEVSIISTYPWDHLPSSRPLQPYILYSLATTVLSKRGGLYFHEEARECPFFIGKKAADIDYSFKGGGLCDSCERSLQAKQRRSEISLEMIAAAKKLFNAASGEKCCFLVMPFRKDLDRVKSIVERTLSRQGWSVVRADQIVRPRRITDAILQATFTSDLVVADLTGSNPNVFYEVGVAHAIGCDVIMLTQDETTPFDVKDEATIFYKFTEKGLGKLGEDLRRSVPRRSSR
jgi:hypothetical protein